MMVRRTFEPTPESVAAARHFVADALCHLDEPVAAEVRDVAELAVSELATNVVQHAGTNYDVIVDTDGPLRIVVEDFSPHDATRTSRTATIHGLSVLGATGGRWGAFRAGTGKQVWWELDLRDRPGMD